MAQTVKKLWGVEQWLVNEPEYCAKTLCIQPGYQCSLHYHKIKKETFIVQRGVIRLEQRDDWGRISEDLGPGESRTILPLTKHRFSVVGELAGEILEISTHHEDSDVVRLEESCALPSPDPLDGNSQGKRRGGQIAAHEDGMPNAGALPCSS